MTRILVLVLLLGVARPGVTQLTTLLFNDHWQAVSSSDNARYRCECEMLGDAFHGTTRCFRTDDGTTVKIIRYEHDKLHGNALEFHDDGGRKLSGRYRNGSPVGEWKMWSEGDSLILHLLYDDYGRVQADLLTGEDVPDLTASAERYVPAVFGTECVQKQFPEQVQACSEALLDDYFRHPPHPPVDRMDPAWVGRSFEVTVRYVVDEDARVVDPEILTSSGDDFIDFLAVNHVLNLIPWTPARKFGSPVREERTAVVRFDL